MALKCLLTALLLAPLAVLPATAPPVVSWTFDEARDTGAVQPAGERLVSLQGPIEFLPGVRGNGLKFDGFTSRLVRAAKDLPRFGPARTLGGKAVPRGKDFVSGMSAPRQRFYRSRSGLGAEASLVRNRAMGWTRVLILLGCAWAGISAQTLGAAEVGAAEATRQGPSFSSFTNTTSPRSNAVIVDFRGRPELLPSLRHERRPLPVFTQGTCCSSERWRR
jgi:hypothetical protein